MIGLRLIEKVQRTPSVHKIEHSKKYTEHNFRHERINLNVKYTAKECAETKRVKHLDCLGLEIFENIAGVTKSKPVYIPKFLSSTEKGYPKLKVGLLPTGTEVYSEFPGNTLNYIRRQTLTLIHPITQKFIANFLETGTVFLLKILSSRNVRHNQGFNLY